MMKILVEDSTNYLLNFESSYHHIRALKGYKNNLNS
jgi:hypothetical protein